jgi:hypothetical protein
MDRERLIPVRHRNPESNQTRLGDASCKSSIFPIQAG